MGEKILKRRDVETERRAKNKPRSKKQLDATSLRDEDRNVEERKEKKAGRQSAPHKDETTQ